MSRPHPSVNCRLRVPNFLTLARSSTFRSSGLCACLRIVCRTFLHHRFQRRISFRIGGFPFLSQPRLLPIHRTTFVDQVLIVRPTIVHFLCLPNLSFGNSDAAYVQVFYTNVMSLCHYPTSINLALFGRVVNQFRFHHRISSLEGSIPFSLFFVPASIRRPFSFQHSGHGLARIRFFCICFKLVSHSIYLCLPKLLNSK